MREKHIKRVVTKQLKQKFPHWNWLARKKNFAKAVLEYVTEDKSSGVVADVSLNEMTGPPAIREVEIMTLADVKHLVFNANQDIFPLPALSRKKHLAHDSFFY